MPTDRSSDRRRSDDQDLIHVDTSGTPRPDLSARARPDADAIGAPGETVSAAVAGPVSGTPVTSIQEDESGTQLDTFHLSPTSTNASFGEAGRRPQRAKAAAHAAGEATAGSDVVRRGGVAKNEAEAEDVTRDTYGVPAAAPTPANREERIANADRAAEQAGMPGVDVPESPFEVEKRIAREEPKRKPERG